MHSSPPFISLLYALLQAFIRSLSQDDGTKGFNRFLGQVSIWNVAYMRWLICYSWVVWQCWLRKLKGETSRNTFTIPHGEGVGDVCDCLLDKSDCESTLPSKQVGKVWWKPCVRVSTLLFLFSFVNRVHILRQFINFVCEGKDGYKMKAKLVTASEIQRWIQRLIVCQHLPIAHHQLSLDRCHRFRQHNSCHAKSLRFLPTSVPRPANLKKALLYL